MTARHQIRIGSRRLGRDRSVIDATPAPTLGEVLQAARERKGVDLFRAERDTKIRLKYLSALEDDDLAELPPPVYTKGFIRNYALYLGLEPEEVIGRWRDQLQLQRRQERVVVAPPPRPLAAPRRGPSITPGMIVAAMISVVVLAFLAFIGWQVFRFVQAPPVALTYPASLVSEIDADSVTLTGTAGMASRVTITSADGQTFTATASAEDGSWSRSVPLAKGRNDFVVVARDPITERDSDPVRVIITVPLPEVTSPPSAAPSPTAITVGLTSPREGHSSTDGTVSIRGTTTGTRITISTEFLGLLPGAEPTVEPTDEPSPEPTDSPVPGESPASSPSTEPTQLDITVPLSGAFDETLTLGDGRWRVTVTAYATGLTPVVQTRSITVASTQPGPVEGELQVILEARGGRSWMRIVVDGEQLRGWGGPTLNNGETVTITAQREVWLRSGNAGIVHVTINGRDAGMLGSRGQVGNWIIEPGSDPRRTTESR
jgi:cytoskeletal protein RodZ